MSARTKLNGIMFGGVLLCAVRCLGFSGQSNSLFFKEKEGQSDGPQQGKSPDQRASQFL